MEIMQINFPIYLSQRNIFKQFSFFSSIISLNSIIQKLNTNNKNTSEKFKILWVISKSDKILQRLKCKIMKM